MNTVNRNRTIKDHYAPECWICAMKSVPGRARSSRRLSVLESQTDNRHVNTVNRNRTIKDHYAPECWICAMKSVPGRARSSRRLSVLESQTDNRHVNTVNRNRTIKDHYAPECWICAMKSVPGSKRFHQTCRLTASFMRAHTQRREFFFGSKSKRDIKIGAAT